MRIHTLLATVVSFVACSSASAAVVFSDGFETDTPGISVSALNNFSVAGTVDVVAPANPYGIAATSNVVDLDGTPGPGKITSQSFGFAANRVITLSFVLGGAQRGSGSDDFFAGFSFSGATQVNAYTLGGAFGNAVVGNFNTTAITSSTAIGGSSPFATYSLSFTSGNAGSLTFNIGTNSADNVGPLLDSVSLDISAVPEPATWGLMVAGFGFVGVGLRRRSLAIATA